MQLQQYEKEHLKQLHRLLPECTVLLKSNGDFPLEQPGTLALYGSGARYTVKGGTGEGNDRKYTRGDILLTKTEKRDILKLLVMADGPAVMRNSDHKDILDALKTKKLTLDLYYKMHYKTSE